MVSSHPHPPLQLCLPFLKEALEHLSNGLESGFPLSLVRKLVTIEVVTLSEFMMRVRGGTIHSFWGHANTLEDASAYVGVDLTPRGTRVAVTLDPDGYPQLEGISFRTCFLGDLFNDQLVERVSDEEDRRRAKGYRLTEKARRTGYNAADDEIEKLREKARKQTRTQKRPIHRGMAVVGGGVGVAEND